VDNKLYKLPPRNDKGVVEIETKAVLKALAQAHRKLGELKGYAERVPNKNILLNAITLNEAKDSSQIENIVTTHDQLFEALSSHKEYVGPTKEVLNYKEAIWQGITAISDRGFLSINMIVDIQEIIEGNKAGIRKQSGTVLKNEATGEIVYTPPETEKEIRDLMKNLEDYINIDDECDELIKMAIIHYQFESIHPFYDGNGRTGRNINILYLILKGLLDSPILYLSKYVIENRGEYYKLLQGVREENGWKAWILYMLKGVRETSEYSLEILERISDLIVETTDRIRVELPKIYSYELIEVIFSEFYTRISNVVDRLGVTRKTAALYLSDLVEIGILREEKKGKEKVFVNQKLVDIVSNN
jgi:Fic family protein